jgi:hypothetical protein
MKHDDTLAAGPAVCGVFCAVPSPIGARGESSILASACQLLAWSRAWVAVS